MNQKVIIVGGGLSGLLLANGLKKNNIPFEVYERDANEHSRGQGWSLSLHFAMPAIRQCMPESSFEHFTERVSVSKSKPDESQVSLAMIDGNKNEIVLSETYDKDAFYRIDRECFREWLLEPVRDSVHWNKQFIRYEETEDSVTAFFEDGTSVVGSILIAADGAKSKITQQVTGDAYHDLTYTLPLQVLATNIWVSEEDWLSVLSTPNKFVLIATQFDETAKESKGKKGNLSCFSSLQEIDKTRKDKPYKILYSMGMLQDESTFPNTLGKTNEEKYALMQRWLELGLNKDCVFHKFISKDLDPKTEISQLVIRERKPSFEAYQTKHQRVVLMGDAAHPMSMYKGEGGNHAMLDAGILDTELDLVFNKGKSLKDAVKEYYDQMIPRGVKAVQESHEAAVGVHTNPEALTWIARQYAFSHSGKDEVKAQA